MGENMTNILALSNANEIARQAGEEHGANRSVSVEGIEANRIRISVRDELSDELIEAIVSVRELQHAIEQEMRHFQQ
jgi:hypothetical protein